MGFIPRAINGEQSSYRPPAEVVDLMRRRAQEVAEAKDLMRHALDSRFNIRQAVAAALEQATTPQPVVEPVTEHVAPVVDLAQYRTAHPAITESEAQTASQVTNACDLSPADQARLAVMEAFSSEAA